jgi:hypothetical protein
MPDDLVALPTRRVPVTRIRFTHIWFEDIQGLWMDCPGSAGKKADGGGNRR